MLGSALEILTETPLGKRASRVMRHFWPSPNPRQVISDGAIFQPFQTPKQLWDRQREIEQLHSVTSSSVHSHVIVTGASGSGKSTLVRVLYKEQLGPDGAKHFYEFENYDRIIQRFLQSLRLPEHAMQAQLQVGMIVDEALERINVPTDEIYENVGQRPEVSQLWASIGAIIDAFESQLSETSPGFFIFDQIERYLFRLSQAVKTRQNTINGLELYLVRNILERIRSSAKIRSVLIIREDYLYKSLDFLKLRSSNGGNSSFEAFAFYICSGIAVGNSPQAVNDIAGQFAKLSYVNTRYARFAHVMGLNTENGANPFLIQIAGFLIERYGSSDRAIQNFINRGTNALQVLPIFFRHLQNAYAPTSPTPNARQLFRAILFAIAQETRTTGLPTTRDRIASLAHVPTEFADDAVEFLTSNGVAKAEMIDDEVGIRLAHDILSDFVLTSEETAFQPELRDTIARLSESFIPSSELTAVKYWSDPVDGWRSPNIGLIAIWAFYIFGTLKLLSSGEQSSFVRNYVTGFVPEGTCSAIRDAISTIIPSHELFEMHSCGQNPIVWYLPIFIMHIVWVTYIYVVDRNHIQKVSKSTVIKFVSATMPLVGAILGVLLAFSPLVHIVPVAAVGTIYAIILILISFEHREAKAFSSTTWQRGTLSLFNMIFLGVLTIILWLLQSDPALTWLDTKLGSIFLAGTSQELRLDAYRWIWLQMTVLFLIYYWSTLRDIHQSHVAAATYVALFDRSRLLMSRD